MTLILPKDLPAAGALLDEGYTVASAAGTKAPRQHLRIALLNLMPNKAETELQFARLMAKSGFPVEMILLRPETHVCKNAPMAHLEAFYRTWSEVRHEPLHGIIVTGAPVETLPFSSVRYWEELCTIFDETRARAIESLFICWAAQAALQHFHKVPKHELAEKAFGVFPQQILQFGSPHLSGMGTQFPCPVSRHTETRWADLAVVPDLRVLAGNQEAGLCLVAEDRARALYMFNHLEYDGDTLLSEFLRDQAATGNERQSTAPEQFCAQDASKCWDQAASQFFTNWLRSAARQRMAATFFDDAA